MAGWSDGGGGIVSSAVNSQNIRMAELAHYRTGTFKQMNDTCLLVIVVCMRIMGSPRLS